MAAGGNPGGPLQLPVFELDVESMTEPVRRITGRFDCSVEAWSWEDLPSDALATDATMRINLASTEFERARCAAYAHLRLERPGGRGAWVLPIGGGDAKMIAEGVAHEGWLPERGPPSPEQGRRANLWDGEYLLETRPATTRAHRWAGAAYEQVTRDLGLPEADEHDQDWPALFIHPDRLEECLAYYDRVDDHDVRFDTMALVLYAFDDRQRRARSPELERWFDDRLRRDFFLHGHLMRYWGCLPVTEGTEPSWAISPQMRRIYFESLRPLHIALP